MSVSKKVSGVSRSSTKSMGQGPVNLISKHSKNLKYVKNLRNTNFEYDTSELLEELIQNEII